MAVLELYGKCKELGYCDCGGFLGCVDPRPPAPKPVIENELANAMKAEAETSDYRNHNYRRELEEIEQSEGGLVECEVCDRSHVPSHPHVANIEGDVPIDSGEPVQRKTSPVIFLPPPDDQLPEWLREKSSPEAVQSADSEPQELCKLCGKPWAPRHDCNPAVDTATKRRVTPYHMRQNVKCDVCGKVKRSDHKCKGRPEPVAEECKDCKRAGELCVRHGGVWSTYDTPKGQPDKQPTDERIAQELPKPTPVLVPKMQASALDPELVAMGAILEAVKGLNQRELKRVMDYVSARLEETE
jgi:hypothetical protein